jgi:hypothetical protein
MQPLQRRPLPLPPKIQTVALITYGVAIVWICYLFEFIVVTLRTCKETKGCWDHEFAFLQRQVISTTVAFAWFVTTRASIFLVPFVAASVSSARASSRGVWGNFISTMLLRDGPHYIFFAAAGWLFLLKLLLDDTPVPSDLSNAPSEEVSRLRLGAEQAAILANDPKSHATQGFMTYSFATFVLSGLCFVLGTFHNKFLDDVYALGGHRINLVRDGAPPDTVEKLANQRYDPAVFGDEDGKAYPADCAICLCPYETGEEIKVTPCGHAFHQDCVARWLRTAHTCALCRADLVELVARASVGGPNAEDSV